MPVSELNLSRLADPQDWQSIYPSQAFKFHAFRDCLYINDLPVLSRLDVLRQTDHSYVDQRQM